MKKIYTAIIILEMFVFSLAGCGNKEKAPAVTDNTPATADDSDDEALPTETPESDEAVDEVSDNGQDGNSENEDDLPVADNSGDKCYICKVNDSIHDSFIFYYKGDKLDKVEYSAYIKGVPEEIETKDNADNYSGVVVEDREDYLAVVIDMSEDGLKYLKDNYVIFSGLDDCSWDSIKSIMENNEYTCVEQ